MSSSVYPLPWYYIVGLAHSAHTTNQQTVGGMDGEAAGKWMVYSESIHIGGLPVAATLVNIPTHVEMQGVASDLTLLAHVSELHVWQMHWREVPKDLVVCDTKTMREHRGSY